MQGIVLYRNLEQRLTLTCQPLLLFLTYLLPDQPLLLLQLPGTLFSQAFDLQSGGWGG